MKCGDARRIGSLLAKISQGEPLLTATITSPPYAWLKDYGADGQIGFGQEYSEYLAECQAIFADLFQFTVSTGSMWLIADSVTDQSRKPSRLIPLPFDLAAAAESAGWTLKDVVVWRKDRTLPWSRRGQLRNSFEYVLFFVKSDDYKYYVDRIREPESLASWWVKWPERYNPRGKVPSDVWEFPIPVQGSWANGVVEHACPLPPNLVERVLLLSTDVDDVVCDPFAGTGTVLAEAERLGRRAFGLEINQTYVERFREVIRPAILGRTDGASSESSEHQRKVLEQRIVALRIVKYGRTLLNELRRSSPASARMIVAVIVRRVDGVRSLDDPYHIASADVTFVHRGSNLSRERCKKELVRLTSVRPASKFGIRGGVDVVGVHEAAGGSISEELFIYEGGRTWSSAGRRSVAEVLRAASMGSGRKGRWPVILSDVLNDEVAP
jgi:DNA modification methylase